MSELLELKKVHLKLSEDGNVIVYFRNKYDFETSITVDAETAATASITKEGITWGSYYLSYGELTMAEPVASPRIIGATELPKDCFHFLYELVSEIFMCYLMGEIINFDALREKYGKCLNGVDPWEVCYRIPEPCIVRRGS